MRGAVHEAFEREQVAFFAELVEQPSCTREPEDVEVCAQLLDRRAAALGLTLERHEDPSGSVAPHRVYRTPAAGAGESALALVGHVDTVFPRALGFTGFRRDGDVVRGPGVLDMKSGLSAMFGAIAALQRAAPELAAVLPLHVVVVTDEEIGSPSSRALYAALASRLRGALVFEAGRARDEIVTRRKGGGLWTLTAHGRAAHAGNRHREGVNAIHALALLVPALEAITDYTLGTTVNVGLFEGGTAKNTVPERAQLGLDARFSTAAEASRLERRLEGLARDPFAGSTPIPERLGHVRFVLQGGVTRPPMEPTEHTHALRARYERCAAACGLGIGEAPLQGGGSDANLLAALGVPCIDGLGPWGEHFHETSEWSSLASLERRTEALALLLLEEAEAAVESAAGVGA